jgi:porin
VSRLTILLLALTLNGAITFAEETKPATAAQDATLFPVPDFTGDVWSRSFLTGDWGGLRTRLANNGVQLELKLTQIFQDVSSGGTNRTGRYSGSADIILKLDSQKLGLWPGGFLFVEAQAPYGNTVIPYAAGIMPVNALIAMTQPASNEIILPHLYFTQFLSEKFAVFLGKLDTSVGDANEFAHGRGDDKFLNLAFSLNPTLLRIGPYAPLGMGFVFLPSKDLSFSFSAMDTQGLPNTSGFDTLFKDPTSLISELRVTVRPFGLVGHQMLGGGWSNGPFTSLNQDPRTIIGTITRSAPLQKESSSWVAYYNFDQYVYVDKGDPSQGIGLFGRFGISDGKANPFHRFYSIGVGGKGLIPTRGKDQFGIGYYYLQFSKNLIKPIRSTVSLDHEQGVELYYNAELLPWLHLTPNLQIIDPSRKELGSLGNPGRSIDTAVVTGFRVKIDF